MLQDVFQPYRHGYSYVDSNCTWGSSKSISAAADLDQPPDQDALQRILLAEISVVRLHNVQQLGHHRRHASEEPRPRSALRQIFETHWIHINSASRRRSHTGGEGEVGPRSAARTFMFCLPRKHSRFCNIRESQHHEDQAHSTATNTMSNINTEYQNRTSRRKNSRGTSNSLPASRIFFSHDPAKKRTANNKLCQNRKQRHVESATHSTATPQPRQAPL